MAPDASQRAQINCAATVAWIEGWARVEVSEDEIGNNTLAALNLRVKLLESRNKIDLPPPSIEPTWESLAWRICRLKHTQEKHIPTTNTTADTPFIDLLPDDHEGSIETLQTICSDLGSSMFIRCMPASWPKCVNDEEMLGVIRQRLCYIAGRERIALRCGIPITRKEIYAELVGLSLKLPPGTMPPFPPPLGWSGISTPRAKRACCGCCNCHCHENNDDEYTDSTISSIQPKRKGTFGFGWIRKLLCWRTKADDDSASIKGGSSSRSSTICEG